MLKVNIADINNKKTAEIDHEIGEKQAVVVATRPLKTFNNVIRFFADSNGNIDLNQNVNFTGTPVNIHDGEDNTYWTASEISGNWDFSSTDQAHTGTQSVDATNTKHNDVAQFAKGNNQDLTNYAAFSGWVYITAWPTSGTKQVNFFGWDVGVGQVGTTVNLGNYVNTGLLNVWQKFVIPFVDMGLIGQTIDAIRIQTISLGTGGAPNYYLDDIQIEENGIPIEYVVEPDFGTWLYAENLQVIMADAVTSTLADATMPNLAYDKLLGVSALTVGMIYRRFQNRAIEFSTTIKQLSDFLQLSGASVGGLGSDGTNTWLILNIPFNQPLILKASDEDKLSIVINDDLSELLLFRISVGGYSENRLE